MNNDGLNEVEDGWIIDWIHLFIYLFIYCFALSTFWEGSKQPCFMGDGFTNLCGKKSCVRDFFPLSFLIFVLKLNFFLLWRLLRKDNFLLLKQVMNGLTHKNFQEEFFFVFSNNFQNIWY